MRLWGAAIGGLLVSTVALSLMEVPKAEGTPITEPTTPGARDPSDGFWLSALRLVAGLPTVHAISTLNESGDVFLETETAGSVSPPFGEAAAIIDGAGVVKFNNESMNPILVTAMVSPNNAEEFTVSAGPTPSSLTSQSQDAFVDLQFGVADSDNSSRFASGSPLFHFHQETTDSTLTGSIPQSVFEFSLLPDQILDLRATITVGGMASIFEPSTLLLFMTSCIGFGFLSAAQISGFNEIRSRSIEQQQAMVSVPQGRQSPSGRLDLVPREKPGLPPQSPSPAGGGRNRIWTGRLRREP